MTIDVPESLSSVPGAGDAYNEILQLFKFFRC